MSEAASYLSRDAPSPGAEKQLMSAFDPLPTLARNLHPALLSSGHDEEE